MFLRFIHVVVYISTLVFIITNISLYGYTIMFFYLSIAVSAAVNSCEDLFEYIFLILWGI